jgi:hypothetical protein
MPSISAITEGHVVRLVTVFRLASPDREEANHQTFVSDGVQVIELRLDFEVFALRVEPVDIGPA